MKKLFTISAIILVILGICTAGFIKYGTGDTYLVNMKIYYIEKEFFKNYDIDIYIDNKKLGNLDPDSSKTYDIELKAGVHTLTVKKETDPVIDGAIEITVSENLQLDYTVTPYSQQIKIAETDKTQ